MPIKMSVALRDARLDQLETTIGVTPSLTIYSGSAPANCAAADTGSVLATISPMPSDWMNASSGGSKTKLGVWSVAASGTGTATHFRIKQGATCHIQGTCSAGGGGGDMILDNTSIAALQTVTVTTFTLDEAAHA